MNARKPAHAADFAHLPYASSHGHGDLAIMQLLVDRTCQARGIAITDGARRKSVARAILEAYESYRGEAG